MSENRRLTEVKTAMLLHTPFFASLLLDLMRVEVTKDPSRWTALGFAPTAATNGKHIWLYEDFFNSLDLREAVFLICHEIGHLMFAHMPRAARYTDLGFEGQEFNSTLWNMAGDFVINDMLVKSGVGSMPKGGLLDKKYTCDMMVDDVYRELAKQPPKCNSGDSGKHGGGSGKSNSSKQGSPNNGNQGGFDMHVNDATQNLSEVEIKRAIATAKEAAKAMGKLPAALERLVEEYLNPVVSWKEKLRHHVTRATSREASTWRTPHRRRLVTQNLYLPSYTGFGSGTVVVAFDTSGSIGARELSMFMAELSDILATTRPERVWLLSCDAKVYEDAVHELHEGDDLVNYPPTIRGGGGTSFVPVFEWIDDNMIDPSAVVYLTDMYGVFPDTAPRYPVIWCATLNGRNAPFGETIFIDKEQS